MKKLIAIIFFTLIFFMPLPMTFAMENVTRVMHEASKQFEEYSWWVKAPVLIVGTYAFTKCWDSLYSRMFGSKVATRQDVQVLGQQLDAANLEINNLKQLNPNNLPIVGLETRTCALEKFEKAKRVMTLSKLDRLDALERDIKLVHYELIGIHELLKSNIHPLFDTKKQRRKSLEASISPRWNFELGKKETLLKEKKRNNSNLSTIDQIYTRANVGTPRDNFFESDSNEGEKEKQDLINPRKY